MRVSFYFLHRGGCKCSVEIYLRKRFLWFKEILFLLLFFIFIRATELNEVIEAISGNVI